MTIRSVCRAIVAGAVAFPLGAWAGSIDPESVVATIGVGETIVVDKTVTTDEAGVGRVDFYFLADNTGSMGGVITSVESVSGDLLDALDAAYADAAFGVGRYFGDPSEGGETFDSAYDVLTTMRTTAGSGKTDIESGISSWIASGGGDTPEANLYALHQAATDGADTDGAGTGSGEAVGWRGGSQKVILWFGDVPGHTDTVTEAEAIAALTGENIIVIGLNSSGAGTGIDGTADGESTQASDITAATDGALVNSFATATDIVDTIVAAVGEVTALFDLTLEVDSGDTSGLDISFACVDALGCDDVEGGESRDFTMTITGTAEGVYSFTVVAPGVIGAIEDDLITVGAAPEPGTVAMLGLGLVGLGLARRRRPRA